MDGAEASRGAERVRYGRSMSGANDHDPLMLPEGARLLYIGPPKTGTTSLQESARAARDALYEQGVYYPGTGRHHRAAVFAILQEPDWLVDRIVDEPMRPGTSYREAGRLHPASEWTRLMDDIDGEPDKRVLITHEWAASASDKEAESFVRGLGRDRAHIVITLRPLAEVLVPQWIESLKEGLTATFEEWLEAFYTPADELISARMRRYLDHAGVVERWARVAGADKVTVIVVDKGNPGLLPETFEHLLGVAPQTLNGQATGGLKGNRSMSRPEAELIQRVNARVVRPEEMSWPAYLTVVRRGAIAEFLETRTPGAAEGRVRLPQWAAERAEGDGAEYAERIAATGVRVVGDLGKLRSRTAAVHDDVDVSAEQVGALRDIAVESLVGAVRATTSYEQRLARRIDRACKQRDRARERRERVQARLEKAKASRDRTREALERQKVKTQRSRERLAQQKEKLEQARGELARLRRRTIHDQVRRLPADQRAQKAAESFGTRDLARALRIRLCHKLRALR